MSLPALLNVGLIAARMGAREIEFGVKKVHSLQVQKKGPTDYVTEMDRRIETLVFEEIKKFYPEHNFLGEEFGHEINNSDTTWILDPIDGTTNFIHGYPQYCISLACKVDDKIEHGIIIDPSRQEEFTASRGKGAELNGERIRASQRMNLKDKKGDVSINVGSPLKFVSDDSDQISNQITESIRNLYEPHSTNYAAYIKSKNEILDHSFSESKINESINYLESRAMQLTKHEKEELYSQYYQCLVKKNGRINRP